MEERQDLITRQEAVDAIKTSRYLVDAMEKIIRLPSTHPEIIRCKECEHWDMSWENVGEPNSRYCPMVDEVRKENWYCADAIRRAKNECTCKRYEDTEEVLGLSNV